MELLPMTTNTTPLYYCNVCNRHTITPHKEKTHPYHEILHCPHCHYGPLQQINQTVPQWQQKLENMWILNSHVDYQSAFNFICCSLYSQNDWDWEQKPCLTQFIIEKEQKEWSNWL